MGKITFVSATGERTEVEAVVGESVMLAAVKNKVPGVVAECGGCLSCATCNVYVPAEWQDKLPPRSADEEIMVECAAMVQENSRLSCQILFQPELDGLVVHTPVSQY